MSKFIHIAIGILPIFLGVGVVGSVMAIAKARPSRPDFDRDDAFVLIKIFLGGSIVMWILGSIYIDSVRP
jgi:hypothetical protein